MSFHVDDGQVSEFKRWLGRSGLQRKELASVLLA